VRKQVVAPLKLTLRKRSLVQESVNSGQSHDAGEVMTSNLFSLAH
jgi:hypothetical protein